MIEQLDCDFHNQDQDVIFNICKGIHPKRSSLMISNVLTPMSDDLLEGDATLPHHLVYKASRFDEKISPNCIFIPSQEFLFKMMRACIDAKTPEDLWIYNDQVSMPIDYNFGEKFEPWLKDNSP